MFSNHNNSDSEEFESSENENPFHIKIKDDEFQYDHDLSFIQKQESDSEFLSDEAEDEENPQAKLNCKEEVTISNRSQEEVNCEIEQDEHSDSIVDIATANRGSEYHQYLIEALEIMEYSRVDHTLGTCSGYAITMMLMFLYGKLKLINTVYAQLSSGINAKKNGQWDLHKQLKTCIDYLKYKAKQNSIVNNSFDNSLNKSANSSFNYSTNSIHNYLPMPEIRMILEAIALIQEPGSYPELFDNKFIMHDKEILFIFNNTFNEEKSVEMPFAYGGLYTKAEYANYFQCVNELALKHKKDFAISLGSYSHRIALLYQAISKTWYLVDANLDSLHQFDSDDHNIGLNISKMIYERFFEKNTYMGFSSEIYGIGLTVDDDFIINLKNSSEHKALHENVEIMKDRATINNYTLMQIAIHIGDDALVEKLCQANTSHLNTFNKTNLNPLKLAATKNQVACLKILIRHGAANDVAYDINNENKSDTTPIKIATILNYVEILQLLLDQKAKVRDFDNMENLLHVVTRNNNHEAFELLVEKIDFHSNCDYLFNESDLNQQDSVRGYTPIMYAASNGNADIFKKLLKLGANYKLTNFQHENLLHCIAINGNIECLKLAIDKFGIETRSKDGKTALLYAAERGHLDAVKFLLEKEANKNVFDNKNKNIFLLAVESNNLETIKYLFEERYVNLADNQGVTPLMCAAKSGNFEICQFLIDNGADVNLVDQDQRTALSFAAISGSVRILRILLNKINKNEIASESKIDSDVVNVAALYNNKRAVELLIEHGYNKNYLLGKSPTIMWAVQKGHLEIIKVLLLASTDINSYYIDRFGRTLSMIAVDQGHFEALRLLLPYTNFETKCDKNKTVLDYCIEKSNLFSIMLILEYFRNNEHIDFNKTLSEKNKNTLFNWGKEEFVEIKDCLLEIPSAKDEFKKSIVQGKPKVSVTLVNLYADTFDRALRVTEKKDPNLNNTFGSQN